MSGTGLTLGMLSMEQYAERLSELATGSISLSDCRLHGPDASLSTHSVADVARYMGQYYARRVTVTCTENKKCCTIERVGKVC